jgi:tRNA G26 N,N-dimethylase Trm1
MDNRILNLINTVKDEIEYPPTYYIIDELCSIIGSKSISTKIAIQRIKSAGYKVISTHFHNRGIKTKAHINDLLKALK